MSDLGVLVPILALSIPLVGVVGHVIVRPVTAALARLAESRSAAGGEGLLRARVEELEARLRMLEVPVGTLMDEHEFRRKLESGVPR